jgi:hypothetical protein
MLLVGVAVPTPHFSEMLDKVGNRKQDKKAENVAVIHDRSSFI